MNGIIRNWLNAGVPIIRIEGNVRSVSMMRHVHRVYPQATGLSSLVLAMIQRILHRRKRSRFDRLPSIRRWTHGAGILVAGAVSALISLGCRTYHNLPETIGNNTSAIDAIMMDVDRGLVPTEYPDAGVAPLTIRDTEALDALSYRDISLQEAIQIALSQASVLRDLGATVLRSPQTMVTDETRGLAQTDPQAGVEAALSAYDAQFYAFGKW